MTVLSVLVKERSAALGSCFLSQSSKEGHQARGVWTMTIPKDEGPWVIDRNQHEQ